MPVERVRLHGRTIGLLDRGAKTYRAIRHYPKDVARALDAYGIDAETIQRLAELGVEEVHLEEHRGRSVRLYRTPLETWIEAPVDRLGERGLWHAFVRLGDLPKPKILRAEPCRKRLACGHACSATAGHWRTGAAHACGQGHEESA